MKPIFLHGMVPVTVIDPISPKVSLEAAVKRLERLLPYWMTEKNLVETIFIGNFSIFKDREINALFDDAAIYVKSDFVTEKDFIDDVVHEFGHALETRFAEEIYDDSSIEKEFLRKRLLLASVFKKNSLPISERFRNLEFSEEFDEYLLKTIGYDRLGALIPGIFLDTYSVSSLREYFAAGFEAFYLGEQVKLSKYCPDLYNKIKILHYTQWNSRD